MKLTFNQKIFLRINSHIGSRPWFDSLIVFCSQWLILILAAGVALGYPREARLYYTIEMTVIVLLALGINWIIGLWYRKPRPQKELPEIKLLIDAFQKIKTFPSDHTTISVLFALSPWWQTSVAPVWLWYSAVIVAALIGFSRTYVGVHYPRDIVAGIIAGGVYALIGLIVIRPLLLRFFS